MEQLDALLREVDGLGVGDARGIARAPVAADVPRQPEQRAQTPSRVVRIAAADGQRASEQQLSTPTRARIAASTTDCKRDEWAPSQRMPDETAPTPSKPFARMTANFGAFDQRPLSPLRQLQRISAADVLRKLVPQCDAAVFGRLAKERVRTAADLASLDKDDLRNLGLSMVERGRITRWAWRVGAAPSNAPNPGMTDAFGGKTGIGFGVGKSFARESLPAAIPESTAPVGEPEDPEEEDASMLRQLEEVGRLAEFWCALAAAEPPAFRRQSSVKSDIRVAILEEWFDVTRERVADVYNDMLRASKDTEGEGLIGVRELGEGLKRCGLDNIQESTLKRVMEVCRPHRKDAGLTLAAFETILSRLKLGQLFRGNQTGDVSGVTGVHLSVVDFNSHSCVTREITDAKFRDFCFGHRPPTQEWSETPLVRWAHLAEFNMQALLCLTVKYSLHPLAVEDAIEQRATKIDPCGGHYFATVQQLCLHGDPSMYLAGNVPVRVAGFHVSAFCSGAPTFDTLVTVAQVDRTFENDWPGHTYDENSGSQHWPQRLRQRLTSAPRSRLRERRADFVLYQVLDLSTDELINVIRAYAMRLGNLTGFVGSESGGALEDEASTCRMQLTVVTRRVRGMQRMLRHFKELPGIGGDLAGSLQEVIERLGEAFEDAAHLAEKCMSILEAQRREVDRRDQRARQRSADKLNKTLSTLTVGTFIFAPMQFGAGVYGMNFQDENGLPTMPELLWENGYFYFWAVTLGYFVTMVFFLGIWYWRVNYHSERESEPKPRKQTEIGMSLDSSVMLARHLGQPQ